MRSRTLIKAAVCSLLVVLCMAQAGLGRRLSANTIDPIASLGNHGRSIVVTGPLQTTQVERIDMRVIVTQRTTGAVAEGHLRFNGTGAPQHWELTVDTVGDERFDAGPATATALAVTTLRGRATDAHQWLVNITLAE